MAAYFIFIREEPTRDQAELEAYWRMLAETPKDPNLRVASMYGVLETVEGEDPDAIVLLEFPNAEAARAWYDSPAYQEAKAHRRRSGRWRGVLVEGIGKPR